MTTPRIEVNALTADVLLSNHFSAAVVSLEAAKHATAANPSDPIPHIRIAEAHIRLAELASHIRFRR